MLIDLTRCIGCRGCQAACKQWHDLPGETTTNHGSYQNPPWVSGKTRTTVTFNEVAQDGQFQWVLSLIHILWRNMAKTPRGSDPHPFMFSSILVRQWLV